VVKTALKLYTGNILKILWYF